MATWWRPVLLALLAPACSGHEGSDGAGDSATDSTASGGSASSSADASGGSSNRSSSSAGGGQQSSDSTNGVGANGSGGAATTTATSANTGGAAATGASGGLSSNYPGDAGIEGDPAVVFYDDFEAPSVSDIVANYDDAKDEGLAISSDVAPGTSGTQSIEMVASGTGTNATDLYKLLDPGYDELYVRYYVKYQAGPAWHHSGMWIGGYNPPTSWPDPRAGTKPVGDDRVSIAIEPIENQVPDPRLDTYNYWMTMHSWMDEPSGDTPYYGNALVHDANFRVDDDRWMCIELHVKLNTDMTSGAGAELGLWKNDETIIEYTDEAPVGYWVKDKFCPESADATSCTDYPPGAGTELVPLDFQTRTTPDLKLNHIWPQNYITEGDQGSVWYDHLVVATERIGCMQ